MYSGDIFSLEEELAIKRKNVKQEEEMFQTDEGRIFVKRFVEVEKSDKHYFDVFDEEGKYLTEITLDTKIQFGVFKNKKLFSIEEDEDGYQYVKSYKVNWNY